MKSRHILIVSALALLIVAQTGWAAATTSGTFDESTYQRFGRGLYSTMDTPSLAGWGVAPLPVWLFQTAPALAGWPEYPRSIALARISAIALAGLPLTIIVYWTLLTAFGGTAAVAGTALLLLSPNIVGNAALATTDICFVAMALGALAALAYHIERPSWRSRALLAAALSLAMAAKYSGLGLFPVVAAALLIPGAGRPSSFVRRIVDAAAVTVGLLVVALVFVWALHAFKLEVYGLPPFENVRMPTPIVGIARQNHHQALGEPAFLLGMHSNFGWWYYILVALAVKSTPVELVLWLAVAVAFVRGWRAATPRGIVWRLAFAVFLAAGIVNHIAFGIRYVLILFPLAVFLAAEQWCGAHGEKRRTLLVPGVLIAAQALFALSIAPHYLSYFNVFAGGPEKGYTKLADSNVDWGQDLPALKRALAAVDARHVLLSYFGTAPVDAYGIEATPWNAAVGGAFERWDAVAISATNLDGTFQAGDPFAEFRKIEPDARAGYSIFIYRTSRPEVRQAMAASESRW